MPGWLTELMKQLPGYAPAFAYASITYGFFLWLDKKASGPAKKAISGWLVPKAYDRAAISVAILEMFDRLYTQPLLSLRAFRRSAVITIVISCIVVYEFGDAAAADLASQLNQGLPGQINPELKSLFEKYGFKTPSSFSSLGYAQT